jgi:hypothetical protein
VIDSDRLATLQKLAATGMGNVGPALKATGAKLLGTPGDTLASLTPEQADKFEAAIGGGLLPANAEPLKGGA